MLKDNRYPFKLPELLYDYDALEPYIDKETMHLHFDKHFNAYITNLNVTLESYPEYHKLTLEELLIDIESLPESIRNSVRNNGGGAFNHDLYFGLMSPKRNQEIPQQIAKSFGGVEEFKKQMKNAAMSRFGSGFAWLVKSSNNEYKIISTPNQDTPLEQHLIPVLALDVWEHAYYLKYQNLRGDYIDNWFKVVNWSALAEGK